MIRIKTLTRADWPSYGPKLQALEARAEYAYGEDFFKIDHGPSYFAFFERLGEPVFQVAVDVNAGEEGARGRVVACAAGVLRRFPETHRVRTAWYLCDLKVDPDYRSRGLPAQLMAKNLWRHWWRCPRAYAVSMNPSNAANPVPRITRRFAWVPIDVVAQLNIYGMTYDQMRRAEREIQAAVGPICYLSLAGQKDLILKSTGARLPLLHVQHGPFADPSSPLARIDPRPGAIHMICAPRASRLDASLSVHLPPSATASLLAHRMPDEDWGFILTSEI